MKKSWTVVGFSLFLGLLGLGMGGCRFTVVSASPHYYDRGACDWFWRTDAFGQYWDYQCYSPYYGRYVVYERSGYPVRYYHPSYPYARRVRVSPRPAGVFYPSHSYRTPTRVIRGGRSTTRVRTRPANRGGSRVRHPSNRSRGGSRGTTRVRRGGSRPGTVHARPRRGGGHRKGGETLYSVLQKPVATAAESGLALSSPRSEHTIQRDEMMKTYIVRTVLPEKEVRDVEILNGTFDEGLVAEVEDNSLTHSQLEVLVRARSAREVQGALRKVKTHLTRDGRLQVDAEGLSFECEFDEGERPCVEGVNLLKAALQ